MIKYLNGNTRIIILNEWARNKKLNLNFVARTVCGEKYDDEEFMSRKVLPSSKTSSSWVFIRKEPCSGRSSASLGWG